MIRLKTALKLQRMFMVILFLLSLYQVTAYCADEKQLTKIVLKGNEDDFYGNFYWPYGSANFGSAENAFMSWERIDENNVGYYEGFLYFVSRNEKEQIDDVGVKDTIEFDLTYDLEAMKATGSLSYYTITTMDYDRFQPGDGGDWLNYANPQWHSKSAKEVVCEVWMYIEIDWELDPEYPTFIEKIVPVDVTFHAKVLRYGNPQDEADEKYEEKTVTENLPVTISISMDNYSENVNPTFHFWGNPGADYASSPAISGVFQCSTDPCSAIQVEWNEPDDSTSTEEEPISEVNTSESATDNPVIVPDSPPPQPDTPTSEKEESISETNTQASTSEETNSPEPVPLQVSDSPPMFGGYRGALLTMGAIAVGGYGLFRYVKKPSTPRASHIGYTREKTKNLEEIIKLTPSSEIDTKIIPEFSEDSLGIKPEKFDGTVDTSNLSMGGKEAEISLETGSRVKVDLEPLPQEEPVSLEDTTLRIEGDAESNEETLDSLNLQPSSEIDVEIKQIKSETMLNLIPGSLYGSLEKGTISLDDKNDMTLNPSSQVKLDVEHLTHEDPVSVNDTTLKLEGDSKAEETQDRDTNKTDDAEI